MLPFAMGVCLISWHFIQIPACVRHLILSTAPHHTLESYAITHAYFSVSPFRTEEVGTLAMGRDARGHVKSIRSIELSWQMAVS